MSFAQERARKEVCEVTENHRIDPQYEELEITGLSQKMELVDGLEPPTCSR